MKPAQGRGIGGRKIGAGGAGSFRTNPDWMPDVSRGTRALTSSDAPTAFRVDKEVAPPLQQEATGNGSTFASRLTKASEVNHPTGPFPVGHGGTSVDFPGSGSDKYGKSGGSFLAAMPAWPPEQPDAPAATTAGFSAGELADEQRVGSTGKTFGDPAFSNFEAGAGFTVAGEQSVGAGPFGATSVLETKGDGGEDEEEDEEGGDENPFA